MSKERLVLIDSNSLLHRAFHALPPLTSPSGEQTGAVYGYVSMLLRVIEELKPEYVMSVWDTHAPTFRHIEYVEYKAHRPETDPSLVEQFDTTRKVVDSLGIPQFSLDGYEADDIIGTLARKLSVSDEADIEVVIVTGDMDALQLVSDRINVFTMKRGLSDTVLYDPEKVRERYGGLTCEQLIDYKSLRGDPSDNIPGVKGIGDKTATSLLLEYGTLDLVYKNLHMITGRTKELLENGRESALLSKRLATIDTDVPIAFSLPQARTNEFDKENAVRIFLQYGFRSLIGRVDKLSHMDSSSDSDVSIQFDVKPNISNVKELINEEWCDWQSMNKNDWKDINVFIAENVLSGATGSMLAYESLIDRILHITVEDFSVLSDEQQHDLLFALSSYYWNIFDSKGCEKVRELYYDTELPLKPVLKEMGDVGIFVDRELLSSISSSLHNKIKDLTGQIYTVIGFEFNINSSKQLGDILYKQIKLPVFKKTKTQPSTDESVLTRLRALHPVIDLILSYRNAYKIQSTYIEPLLACSQKDSRVHTTFNQINTSSGRLSSENPNLQNIPINDEIELRRVFCAPKERMLLVADYSQIELRIMAHITQDEGLMESFRHNQDIHLATAARIFNKRTDEVRPEERKTGKTINFALMYGMGPHGLSDSLGISRGEAKLYIDGFFRSYPKVKVWQERVLEEVKEKGYVETLFGRRRVLTEILDKNFHRRAASERIAINHPLQGTQADIVKMAMVKLDKLLIHENLTSAKMLLQVHDELILEIDKADLEKASELVKRVMETVVDLKVHLKVDVKAGSNWHDTVSVY